MVRSSCLLSRSVAAKVSMCSVCVRTGWWGYLLSCHRPQNCTYSTSQEIGLSPCVNFSPGGKEFRQQWAKCLRKHSIHFLPYGYPALHMIADCHVLAVFFCCISWYLLCCRKVYYCRHANVRLHVYRWSFSTTLSSIHHLFFLLSFQAAKPADLPDHTTSQGLVAVGESVTASPYFSDRCGSRDGREGAHLCAAAPTVQQWQQR